MIAASLLFYPLKIFLFLAYPTVLIVRALQYKRENDIQQENNRKSYILLLALVYVVFSILESMFSDLSNKFFLLTLLTIGGLIAKEKGILEIGIQQIMPFINKLKQQ